MLIKTDPNCDPATWAENFTMAGVHIHDNYIHNTEEGEGMYIGYTGKSRKLTCDGQNIEVFPHKLTDVNIHNNRLAQIAADGIQLNSVKGNSRIALNSIYRTGVSPFSPYWQNTGIQVGGDDVEVSHNTIYKSGGNGMMLDGDNLRILNNKIIFAGENGIFARNQAQQTGVITGGEPHVYSKNVIIQSASYGIKLYATHTRAAHLISENTIENFGELDAANRPMTYSLLNQDVAVNLVNNQHYVLDKEL